MATIVLYDLGKFGIVKETDARAQDLPPEAWTDGLNVRFQDSSIQRFKGQTQILGTPTVAPYWALSVPNAGGNYWFYAGLTKVYATATGATHSDITRAVGGNYSATAAMSWNGGILGGIPILNNGVDVPQYWTGTDPTVNKLANLTNWPASYKAKIIRPFGYFLIAMSITDNLGNEFPHRYKWGSPAEPGTLPVSWDITDPTEEAGEADLTDVVSGVIRDGMSLRDTFIIYKQASTHGLQFVGGDDIFKSIPLLDQSGILATDCVVALPKGKGHFVATEDDLIIFNGQTAESVIDRKWRKWLAQNIDATYFELSYCTYNPIEREAWFCFPEVGSTAVNKALVVNLNTSVVSIRDLASMSFIANGPITSAVLNDPWSADDAAWDTDFTNWNDQPFQPYTRKMLGCQPGSTKLLQLDTSDQFDGTNFRAFVERTGLAVVGRDRFGDWKSDFSARKLVRRVWPQITGAAVSIYVGAQENPDEAIIWSGPFTFTPGVDKYIDPDPTPTGRMLAIRFESTGNAFWQISGYNIEIELLGQQ